MISKPEEYDHLFQNLIPNSIEGIKIFGVNDSYVKPQNYDSVTNLENSFLLPTSIPKVKVSSIFP